MFSTYRVSLDLMKEVQECINSNTEMYNGIVDPKDLSEHHVDDQWAKRNFQIREFYLARDQGQYVGTASYQKLGNFAYIGYFYIKHQYLRKGYGQQLMQFMELRTMQDNIQDLRLFCNPGATWAVAFYKKQCFSILSSKKQQILTMDHKVMQPFYEENSYFMQKILTKVKPLQFGASLDIESDLN